MPAKINITGLTFGRLTVLSESDLRTKDGKVKWLCRCSCGIEKIISGKELRNGDSRSCGCLERETLLKRNTKHGLSKTPEYHIWKAIKQRCCNIEDHAYKDYGGRGITMCDRWLNSFENFISDMGDKPEGLFSIDRKDNDLGYSPDNCFWATKKEQGKNKRNNRWITHNGETKHLQGWADYFMIPVSTLHSALKVKSFEYLYEKYAF